MLLLCVGKPQLKHVPVVFLQPEVTNKSFREALHVSISLKKVYYSAGLSCKVMTTYSSAWLVSIKHSFHLITLAIIMGSNPPSYV